MPTEVGGYDSVTTSVADERNGGLRLMKWWRCRDTHKIKEFLRSCPCEEYASAFLTMPQCRDCDRFTSVTDCVQVKRSVKSWVGCELLSCGIVFAMPIFLCVCTFCALPWQTNARMLNIFTISNTYFRFRMVPKEVGWESSSYHEVYELKCMYSIFAIRDSFHYHAMSQYAMKRSAWCRLEVVKGQDEVRRVMVFKA